MEPTSNLLTRSFICRPKASLDWPAKSIILDSNCLNRLMFSLCACMICCICCDVAVTCCVVAGALLPGTATALPLACVAAAPPAVDIIAVALAELTTAGVGCALAGRTGAVDSAMVGRAGTSTVDCAQVETARTPFTDAAAAAVVVSGRLCTAGTAGTGWWGRWGVGLGPWCLMAGVDRVFVVAAFSCGAAPPSGIAFATPCCCCCCCCQALGKVAVGTVGFGGVAVTAGASAGFGTAGAAGCCCWLMVGLESCKSRELAISVTASASGCDPAAEKILSNKSMSNPPTTNSSPAPWKTNSRLRRHSWRQSDFHSSLGPATSTTSAVYEYAHARLLAIKSLDQISH